MKKKMKKKMKINKNSQKLNAGGTLTIKCELHFNATTRDTFVSIIPNSEF